jgi:proteasome accessory factor C
MERIEQIYKLHQLLKQRRTAIPRKELEHKLEVSRATLTRLLETCRERFGMPIEFSRQRGGYCYDEQQRDTFELPGLWFSAAELRALMVSHRLLSAVEPGVLKDYISPLQQRIESLLQHRHAGSPDVWQRIRILPVANREARLEDFQQVSDALVARKRLRIVYSSRSKDEVSERQVSPQRLVYYRDNWYLDAWCHLRKALRTFALDSLRVLDVEGKARDVPDSQLDAHVAHTYGIFAGPVRARAVIHFSAAAARWVADEEWHPQQESRHLEDGRWELVVPYGDPTELVRDILKFGPEAEVVAPPELRALVMEQLSQALRRYRRMRKV